MAQTFIIDIPGADGTSIPVLVARKRVKNYNLRVTPTGAVHASIPLSATRASAEDFIARNRSWILARLAHQAEQGTGLRAHGLLTATSTVALWGRAVKLGDALARNFEPPRVQPPQTTFATFLGVQSTAAPARQRPRVDITGLTQDEITRRIDALYKDEVALTAPQLIHGYEIKMDVKVTRLTVRSMKTRWGSCTPRTGTIRLALELAAYPPECLDMVVAHELTHLLEPSHNARFHQLLDAFYPDNRAVADRLKHPALG